MKHKMPHHTLSFFLPPTFHSSVNACDPHTHPISHLPPALFAFPLSQKREEEERMKRQLLEQRQQRLLEEQRRLLEVRMKRMAREQDKPWRIPFKLVHPWP